MLLFPTARQLADTEAILTMRYNKIDSAMRFGQLAWVFKVIIIFWRILFKLVIYILQKKAIIVYVTLLIQRSIPLRSSALRWTHDKATSSSWTRYYTEHRTSTYFWRSDIDFLAINYMMCTTFSVFTLDYHPCTSYVIYPPFVQIPSNTSKTSFQYFDILY